MIDGIEKRNRLLAFELQNSHVCEKRSNNKNKTLNVSNVGYFFIVATYFFIVATSVSLEIPTESHIIYLREDHGLPAYPPKIFSPLLITTRVGGFPSHLL